MTLAGFLAWPDGSGLVGTAIMGAVAYVHTHVRLGRQHAERMAQAERLGAAAPEPAAGPPTVNVTMPAGAGLSESAREIHQALLELKRRNGGKNMGLS